MSGKMMIVFKGRNVNVDEVCPGIVKKSDTVYYIADKISGEWLYCSNTRLGQLVAKAGSLEKVGLEYTGRESKRTIRSLAQEAVANLKTQTIAPTIVPAPEKPEPKLVIPPALQTKKEEVVIDNAPVAADAAVAIDCTIPEVQHETADFADER